MRNDWRVYTLPRASLVLLGLGLLLLDGPPSSQAQSRRAAQLGGPEPRTLGEEVRQGHPASRAFGGDSSVPSARGRDSLTAAAVAFRLRYGASSRPAPARDRWLARDKVKHVVVSGLWTLSTQYVFVNKADWTKRDALPVSIVSGATIGILKELYDASRLTGTASGKDLVADAVGIGLAVGVIVL